MLRPGGCNPDDEAAACPCSKYGTFGGGGDRGGEDDSELPELRLVP